MKLRSGLSRTVVTAVACFLSAGDIPSGAGDPRQPQRPAVGVRRGRGGHDRPHGLPRERRQPGLHDAASRQHRQQQQQQETKRGISEAVTTSGYQVNRQNCA